MTHRAQAVRQQALRAVSSADDLGRPPLVNAGRRMARPAHALPGNEHEQRDGRRL
jgi:hypothetical protein